MEAKNHASTVQHQSFVDNAIKDLLSAKSIEQVHTKPIVVSPLGVAANKQKLRLIWDGRYVNDYLVIPELHYESLGYLKEILNDNDFMFTLNLKSGYHHLDIHEDFWQYLGFQWDGQFYVFTQLPFGLAPACWAFSVLTRAVLKMFLLYVRLEA